MATKEQKVINAIYGDIINTYLLTVICYNNDMFVVIKNSLLLSAVILSP